MRLICLDGYKVNVSIVACSSSAVWLPHYLLCCMAVLIQSRGREICDLLLPLCCLLRLYLVVFQFFWGVLSGFCFLSLLVWCSCCVCVCSTWLLATKALMHPSTDLSELSGPFESIHQSSGPT